MYLDPNQKLCSNEFVKNWYGVYFLNYCGKWKNVVEPITHPPYSKNTMVPFNFDGEKFQELVRLAKKGYDLEQQEKTSA